MPKGVVWPPPKGRKKKKEKWVLGFGGWPDQGLGGGFGRRYGVAKATLGPRTTPPKPKTHFSVFILFFYFSVLWGWLDHPLGHGGSLTTPIPAVGGGSNPPKPKTHFSVFILFFYFSVLWGWLDHPLGHGGSLTTPIPAVGGGSSHPLAKNGVAGPPHFVQGGGWSHSRFSSFSVFVFVFDFHLFFLFSFSFKKIIIMAKTTSFWAG
jgi:hypothetical protein